GRLRGAVVEVRRAESHRVVQGPRDGRGGGQGGGGRRAQRGLRVDRQHFRERGGVLRSRRHPLQRRGARRKGGVGQAGAGGGARSAHRGAARKLRRSLD